MGSWSRSHHEVILAELVTGNPTLNQTAALEQPGGTVIPSDRLPSHPVSKRWKSHRQLFRPYWDSSVWRTDGCVRMTWEEDYQ